MLPSSPSLPMPLESILKGRSPVANDPSVQALEAAVETVSSEHCSGKAHVTLRPFCGPWRLSTCWGKVRLWQLHPEGLLVAPQGRMCRTSSRQQETGQALIAYKTLQKDVMAVTCLRAASLLLIRFDADVPIVRVAQA